MNIFGKIWGNIWLNPVLLSCFGYFPTAYLDKPLVWLSGISQWELSHRQLLGPWKNGKLFRKWNPKGHKYFTSLHFSTGCISHSFLEMGVHSCLWTGLHTSLGTAFFSWFSQIVSGPFVHWRSSICLRTTRQSGSQTSLETGSQDSLIRKSMYSVAYM